MTPVGPLNLVRPFATVLAVVFPALGIYLGLASAFAGWVVDDAGITFSYARNLVLGYGLVAQPGAEPVEGFTSLSWCLLQTPFLEALRKRLRSGVIVKLTLRGRSQFA